MAGDIRACTQVQATKSRPEVEQALHGQRRDAGCDDGEGKICAVGNEHVVRPAVNESPGMRNKQPHAVLQQSVQQSPEEPRCHENKKACERPQA